ncbi:MAG: class I poly(R)-hydroxyalkanoic acid synthase [Bauldia sp.]
MSPGDNGGAWPLFGLFRDPEALSRNLARLMAEGSRAAATWLAGQSAKSQQSLAEEIGLVVKTLKEVSDYWLSDPARAAEAQRRLMSLQFALWTATWSRSMGLTSPYAASAPRDKRFADPEWAANPVYSWLREAYDAVTAWATGLVADAVLDADTKRRAEFYVRQIAAALSPSNFPFANPEVLRATAASNGENLVRGAHMLAEDLEAGKGELKLRQTDTSGFELGRDIAATPGKVIHQNALCQLIQYQPATATVAKLPLLIVPPWINKYYVLDLTPEKSFVRWAVEQGHTVFIVSWVNPDASHAAMDWGDYMRLGILESLDVMAKATGEKRANVAGYCVGGTLLAVTLAYLAAKGDKRIASATLMATQVDFREAGDLKVFADAEQIAIVEERMEKRGYLEGKDMALAFNMLRPNDLIWPNVVNTYLLGKQPTAFDLLYWNADATRMPAANHSFYLRSCYLNNSVAKGDVVIDGVAIDIGRIAVPVYCLAAADDHIAPPTSVYVGARLFGGPVTFVLAGAGHIAGVMNGPARNKYQYWTDGDARASALDGWRRTAAEHPGSWWTHWQTWIGGLDGRSAKARRIGARVKPIEDAPGSYVRVKA